MKELEKEEMSDEQIENMLEISKLREIRTALKSKGQNNLFDEISDLQQFGAMIDKRNKAPQIDRDRQMSQLAAIKLVSSVPCLCSQ